MGEIVIELKNNIINGIYMDKEKIILVLKEHNPTISEVYSDEELLNVLTGLEIVGVVAVKAVQNAVNAINKLAECDPQFKSLVEVSAKVNEVHG